MKGPFCLVEVLTKALLEEDRRVLGPDAGHKEEMAYSHRLLRWRDCWELGAKAPSTKQTRDMWSCCKVSLLFVTGAVASAFQVWNSN